MSEDDWLEAAYEDKVNHGVDDIDLMPETWECPGCGYEHDTPRWGPDGLCRDCYEDRIPAPYCEHGTYIGGPGGPDYLCGYCEMGY